MLYEQSRAVTPSGGFDMSALGALASTYGPVVDFGAEGQMRETNEIIEVLMIEDAVAGGSLSIEIEHSEDGDSFSDIFVSSAIASATLVKGYVIYKAQLPEDTKRYVRMRIRNTTSTAFTGGKLFGVIRPL